MFKVSKTKIKPELDKKYLGLIWSSVGRRLGTNFSNTNPIMLLGKFSLAAIMVGYREL